MAAGLILAKATDREICRVGQRGEELEVVTGAGMGHLGPVPADEGRPLRWRHRPLSRFDGIGARGQVGKPDVIPIVSRKTPLRDAAGRVAHGSNPDSLIDEARGTKLHDADAHG